MRTQLTYCWVGIGLVLGVGCGGSQAEPSGTQVVATPAVEASNLAPSQLTPSTVARPEAPPACDPAQLSFVAAAGGDPTTVAVITITNQGDAWCEVDVFDSPAVDPLMEPDVWLEPSADAELIASEVDPGCATPVMLESIPLVVNGSPVSVPVADTEACSVLLTALAPV